MSKIKDILSLKDTDLTELDELKTLPGYDCICRGVKTNARRIAFIIGSNFEYTLIHTIADDVGNILFIDI